MRSSKPLYLSGIALIALSLAACDAFENEAVMVALMTVPTDSVSGVYFTSPTALFIEGHGIGLSSTDVVQEGCADRALGTPGGAQNVDFIEAGTSVTARFAGPDVTLVKTTVNGHVEYRLPPGQTIAFTPGDVITFTIPGVAGGFPARQVTARTAEAFTAAPITLPVLESESLTVTWDPGAEVPGSAMFYSIRYSSAGATQDRELGCVFRDDGSGVIGSTFLTNLRAGTNRTAIAQRGRVTATRVGNTITHVTSVFELPVTLTDIN